MNENDTPSFRLECRDPRQCAPVLAGVQWQGRLDGVLLEQALVQRYRHEGTGVLEVVYTFPLPPRAVLLGFAATLNGRRLEGVVAARATAEARYEEALAQGDAPLLLEALGGGLHTVNIGNLTPRDTLEVELRFAELLPFEQGRLRVAVPTTIAPRYGHAGAAGLQPQQVPVHDVMVEYPLEAVLTVGPALAGAVLECPTHAARIEDAGDGSRRIGLPPGARLDRDLVVIATPREPRPSLLLAAGDPHDDGAPQLRVAALQPAAAATPLPVSLHLLVDCSGSMQGDSIDSAREALRGLLAALDAGDRVALSRFGGEVEHLAALTPVAEGGLRRLAPAVDELQADLGGTEMEQALLAVFAQPQPADDVLVVTDGEVWAVDELVAAAQRDGRRVFVIGVGHSPAEAVLRRLAEATGGACEVATPGEALAAAARRMLVRLRQPRRRGLRVDWGAAPVWQTRLPQGVFDGDTLFALAGFARGAAPGAIRLIDGMGHELARTEAQAPVDGDTLARLAAARRWSDAPQAPEFAVRYQLVTEATHCVLVHERAEAERPVEPAQLHRVASMQLMGGTRHLLAGSSLETRILSKRMADRPNVRHMLESRAVDLSGEIHFSIADWSDVKPPAAAPRVEPYTLAQLLHTADFVVAIGDTGGLLSGVRWHDVLRAALDAVQARGLSPAQAEAVLLDWLLARPGAPALGDRAALAARVRALLAGVDATALAGALSEFERALGGYAWDAWEPQRARRLRRALESDSGVA